MQEIIGLIPVLERSPGAGNVTHSSILAWEIRGAWQAIVHKLTKESHVSCFSRWILYH